MEKVNRFNIRVYGILVWKDMILLSDEIRKGNYMTKFPGGGLELGEGIEDGLIREFQEELGVKVEVRDLFYITTHFQRSAFNPEDQLISIYFKVHYNKPESIPVVHERFKDAESNEMVARWVKVSEINESSVTYPIDKLVIKKLKDIQ
jgi:ADP-ribose pyrophosphatase YjhB (NUDIX family)